MSAAFNPAAWLQKFNSVGGHVVIGGKSFRAILDFETTNSKQQDEARELSRVFDDAEKLQTIKAFLCNTTLSEFRDAQRIRSDKAQ